MTLETSVANLTTATTALMASVNVQKAVLDGAVTNAATQAGLSAAAANQASSQASNAATQAQTATTQAAQAAAQTVAATAQAVSAEKSSLTATSAQAAATGQAVIATSQSTNAQSSASSAATAKTAAEAARDAALIQAGVYVDEPTGRAAVADGAAFKVQGAGDVAAFEHRRTSSTASVLIASYPSSASVQDINLASDFVSGVNPLFRTVKKLRLYGANTAKFYRVRYFFRNDSGVRFNFTVEQCDDASGTNPVDVCAFALAGTEYAGKVEFTLAQVAASGITGSLIVDFTGAPATWGIYASSNATAIRADATQNSVADLAYYGAALQTSPQLISLTTRVTDIESATDFLPGSNALFKNVKKLRLFGANPSKFYSVRYFFRNDSGVRFNFTITQSDTAAGVNPVDVCAFSSSGEAYSGLKEFSLSPLAGSGVTGTLIVDFTAAPASFSAIRDSGGESFATLAVRADALASSVAQTAAQTAVATAVVNANAALTSGLKLPFVDALNNDFLRRLVKEIYVYGADPAHVYILSQLEIQPYRCTIVLRDITLGADVAKYIFTATISDYNTLAPYWKLGASTLGTAWKGVYAVMKIDWSKAITGDYNYTLATESGISPVKLRSDESISDYLNQDTWQEVIKVGAGRPFTTLRAAVESLYSVGTQECARSCYDYQILIDLVDEGTFNATNLIVPEFVSVRGLGVDKTFITKESNTTKPIFQAHFDTKMLDLTVVSDTGDGGAWVGEYCIHSDDFNKVSLGGADQNRRLRQSFKRLKLQGGVNQNAWVFGCGTSSGQHIRFEDVNAEHRKANSAQAAFGFHNSGPTLSQPDFPFSAKPSLVELIGCRSSDATAPSVYVQSLGGGNKSRLVLRGCEFGIIQQAVATGELDTDRAADRYEWEYGGVHSGAVFQADADMLVLATTAGQMPSGSAAALIFGVTDELGRGDKWIKTGTTKSLGARLGDCSVTNKLLTIGAQTCTFTTNLTASTNASVLALVNAAITTNPVIEKNIQFEIYPDLGYTRRMINNTGATIAAGKFVKRTSVNTIALATGDDDVMGFVYRDILTGLAGNVVTTKSIHAAYITNAGAAFKFGITAGLLDYGSTIKKGFVSGSLVTLY